jgi:hypothetical protein
MENIWIRKITYAKNALVTVGVAVVTQFAMNAHHNSLLLNLGNV